MRCNENHISLKLGIKIKVYLSLFVRQKFHCIESLRRGGLASKLFLKSEKNYSTKPKSKSLLMTSQTTSTNGQHYLCPGVKHR